MGLAHADLTRLGASRLPIASVQGTLALETMLCEEPPPPVDGHGLDAEVVPIARARSVARRRELEAFLGRLVCALAEGACGLRPVAQLVRWTTPDVYADIAWRSQVVLEAGAGQAVSRPQAARPKVVSVHTCYPMREVAEVAAHVRYGARSRALAARFELRGDRWICTIAQFS